MDRSLHTVLEHAERQRDDALTALREAEGVIQRLQVQADQLQAYRAETEQRHPAQGGRTATIELLRYHQGFVQRLEQAIAQQQAQMIQAQSRATARRAQLLALETRVASVRKLIERRGTQQRQREAAQEQRRMDDAASRRSVYEHAGSARGWRSTTMPAPL
jgi:flagellar FliJ protein